MSVTQQDVVNCFRVYGWQCKMQPEGLTQAGFSTKWADLLINASLTDEWLSLSIMMSMPPIASDRQASVHRYLLELNTKIVLVRFGLLPDSQIVLVGNVLAKSDLDYKTFEMVLDALTLYAEDIYPHLYRQITGQMPKPGEEATHEQCRGSTAGCSPCVARRAESMG